MNMLDISFALLYLVLAVAALIYAFRASSDKSKTKSPSAIMAQSLIAVALVGRLVNLLLKQPHKAVEIVSIFGAFIAVSFILIAHAVFYRRSCRHIQG
jgi:hypothetical protein